MCGQSPNIQTKFTPNRFSEKLEVKTTSTLIGFIRPIEFSKNHLEAIKMSTGVKNNLGRETESLDKSKPVFVYRLSGGQSSSVANAVRAAGFKEVY